jgi:hypothetical protein
MVYERLARFDGALDYFEASLAVARNRAVCASALTAPAIAGHRQAFSFSSHAFT